MNFKDIIGPDELDWKVIPLDWKKIGKDELKLGTPMSKDGLEANDASCYGILMDDVEKSKHFQARVIVSGCVDFAKAEEYSGIKISEEAKKAIGKVWSQAGGDSGPIDPKRLPEGYPYKEEATILDGTFEFADMGGGMYASPIEDETFALVDGTTYTVIWDGEAYQCVAGLAEESGTVFIGNPIMMGGAEDTGEPFVIAQQGEETAMATQDTAATHTVKVCTETIHPMAPEFLPEPLVLYVMEV